MSCHTLGEPWRRAGAARAGVRAWPRGAMKPAGKLPAGERKGMKRMKGYMNLVTHEGTLERRLMPQSVLPDLT